MTGGAGDRKVPRPSRCGADVAIVGGGVIGLALAREASARGLDVVLLERGRAGEEASSAAAGLLSAQSDAPSASPFFELALESRDLYPAWVEALEQETGLPCGWRRTGVLRVGEQAALARFLWQRERSLSVEVVGRPEIARLSAGRAADPPGDGLFFAEDAVVDPRLLVRALRRSLELRGVPVREGAPVHRFIVDTRCRGVETSAGPVFAERVVDAAGAWAALDPALSFPVPVTPVRGQMVALADDLPFPTVLESERVYLVPRSDGRILAGATVENAGFRNEVTAAGIAGLLADAIRLAPSMATARLVAAWAGLRPGTPDGLPLLGESPVPGLFLAAGHFRNGILLAPVTALALADALAGSNVRDLSAFAVDRFTAAARRR